MKEYLLNLWEKVKRRSIKFKIFLSILIVLYIGIITVSIIQLDVDATTPGSINNVGYVIDIESENKTNNVYTVSVFSRTRVSLLQYALMKLDKNIDIELGQNITYDIFTEKEDYASNVAYKNQSIQDSIIVAYTTAIKEGFNITLDYSYKGQTLLNIPQNLYKTGSEDFKNGDIVTGYNDVSFTTEEDYLNSLNQIFAEIKINDASIKELKDNNKFLLTDESGNRNDSNIKLVFEIFESFKTNETKYTFNIIRDNENKKVTSSLKMLFYLYTGFILKNDKIYTLKSNNFTTYTINYDKCNPKININESTTVGPSGGLLQTLAVFNSIIEEDITKGKKIMGTGGINLDGEATIIGGVKQKVITANLYAADVFFVPSVNYKEAKEQYDLLKDPTYDLVKVETFNDVLNYLKKLEVNNG